MNAVLMAVATLLGASTDGGAGPRPKGPATLARLHDVFLANGIEHGKLADGSQDSSTFVWTSGEMSPVGAALTGSEVSLLLPTGKQVRAKVERVEHSRPPAGSSARPRSLIRFARPLTESEKGVLDDFVAAIEGESVASTQIGTIGAVSGEELAYYMKRFRRLRTGAEGLELRAYRVIPPGLRAPLDFVTIGGERSSSVGYLFAAGPEHRLILEEDGLASVLSVTDIDGDGVLEFVVTAVTKGGYVGSTEARLFDGKRFTTRLVLASWQD